MSYASYGTDEAVNRGRRFIKNLNEELEAAGLPHVGKMTDRQVSRYHFLSPNWGPTIDHEPSDHRVRITCPDCGESAYVETKEKSITENPWWETRCQCREWSLVIVAEGRLLEGNEGDQIAAFCEWIKDNYGIEVPDRVIEEYRRYSHK